MASPLRWVLLVRCNPEGKCSFTQLQFPERWVLLHSGFSNSHFRENPSRISCGTSRIPRPTTTGSKNIEAVSRFGNTDYLPIRWLRRYRAALPPRYPPRPEGRGLPRNPIKPEWCEAIQSARICAVMDCSCPCGDRTSQMACAPAVEWSTLPFLPLAST